MSWTQQAHMNPLQAMSVAERATVSEYTRSHPLDLAVDDHRPLGERYSGATITPQHHFAFPEARAVAVMKSKAKPAYPEESPRTSNPDVVCRNPEPSSRDRGRTDYVRSPFLGHLNAQEGELRQRGRIAVLDVPYGHDVHSRYTMKSHAPGHDGHPYADLLFSKATRLVIIEDMGADWVKPFAQWLQLPEHLFALHWTNPNDHLLGNAQIPLAEDPRRHFILQYRQPLPFKMTKPDTGEHERLACTAQRTVVRRIRALKDLQTEDIETAEQMVSFYRGSRDGRDIAVLLVDPCPTIEDQFPHDPRSAVRREPRPHTAIKYNGADWRDWEHEDEDGDDQQDQVTLSIYDELYDYFNSLSQDQLLREIPNADVAPAHVWASHCCNIVLAKNASTVQSSFVETWKLIGKASTGVKKLADFDFDKLERKAWSDDWKGEFFTQLWELREELELTQYKLEMNKMALSRLATRQDEPTQITSNLGHQTLWEPSSTPPRARGDRHVHKGDHMEKDQWDSRPYVFGANATKKLERTTSAGTSQVHIGNLKGQIIYTSKGEELLLSKNVHQDLEEWDRLLKMNSYAIQLMDRTTDTYVQAIGATATQFANEQSKNSKKLTGFAAVFVPASLCAAILAIPSFTPDAKNITKFLVFWVVSVPLAVILAVLFLTDLPQWIKRRWTERPSQRTEDDLKEAIRYATSKSTGRMRRRSAKVGLV